MKKKILFLLLILLFPITALAEEVCELNEFGENYCYEKPDVIIPDVEEEVPIEIPDDTPVDIPVDPTFASTKLTYLKVVNYGFEFDPDTLEYEITIPYDLKELYVVATGSEGATITGAGEIELDKEKDSIVVTVNYPGLQPTIYRINISKNNKMLIMIIICVLLSIGLVGTTIYAIINRDAYLGKVKKEKNRLNILPKQEEKPTVHKEVVTPTPVQPVAVPQQIKVVKSVASTTEPSVIKKQVVISTQPQVAPVQPVQPQVVQTIQTTPVQPQVVQTTPVQQPATEPFNILGEQEGLLKTQVIPIDQIRKLNNQMNNQQNNVQ